MSARPLPPPPRSFRIVRGLHGWMALRPRWQAMLDARMEPDCIFRQPAWYGARLQHLCDSPDELAFVCAQRGDRLEAVLPLTVDQRPFGAGLMTLREARTPVHAHQLISDLALAPGMDADDLWPELFDWLQGSVAAREIGWDLLRLDGVIAGSGLDRAARSERRPAECSMPLRESAWLDCSGTPEQALAPVSRSHHGNVRRLMRRAQSRGALRFEVVESGPALEAALEQFLQLEASGWKAETGSAIARSDSLSGFYRALARQFADQRTCRIHLLRLDGQAIAAQFALLGARTLHLVKIAYLESEADLAPGHLIMREAIESACADARIDRLSFVTHPPWAHLWKPHIAPVSQHLLFHRSLRGWAIGQLRRWRSAGPAVLPRR